jgi:hypothetical protein
VVPGDQPIDEDDENDEGGPGGPGGPSGPSGPGGPSGRGRGNGGLSKQVVPSDRKLRSCDVTAPKEPKVWRINRDVEWERTLSQWYEEAATANRHYGKPAPLTASSLSALPHIPKPHLRVGTEGGEGMGHYLFFFFFFFHVTYKSVPWAS